MSVIRAQPQKNKSARKGFRFRDLFIIILCLSGIAYCIHLFWEDLFQTINLQNVKPVGTIIIKQNIVQRRLEDRVLWDRLAAKSPVYMGDLIRVADLSAATLVIEGQQLDLNQNTLIRIQRYGNDEGIQIELSEGSIGVITSGGNGSLYLNLMGTIIEAAEGTTINASAGEDGIAIHVNEGTVFFVDGNGQSREITSGGLFAADAGGTEKIESAAVVMRPKPNARYLKTTSDPVYVNFTWNRVNLEFDVLLRMETAADSGFNAIVQTYDNLFDSVQMPFYAGAWFWRLTYNGKNLSTGRINVVDALGVNLLSPIRDSIIRYQANYPDLHFQWTEAEEASQYILEISDMPDFAVIEQIINVSAVSFVRANLDDGTWYWRVTPVYPSGYEGRSVSSVSMFFAERIPREHGADFTEEDALILPEAAVLPSEPSEASALSQDASSESALQEFRQTEDIALTPAPQAQPGVTPPRRTPPRQTQPQPLRQTQPQPVMPDGTPVPDPLLPVPRNMTPEQGYRIDIERLKEQRSVIFRWSPVPGANAYIFSIFEQTPYGRQPVMRTSPENRTEWILESISELYRGAFVWQVEAVIIGSDGEIVRRGTAGESSFVIDIPQPEVHANKPGVLYGN